MQKAIPFLFKRLKYITFVLGPIYQQKIQP